MAKNKNKSEARAFLDSSPKGDAQASHVSESEGAADAAGEKAGEAGLQSPPQPAKAEEVVKPAKTEEAKALSSEVPGKYRKFVK